MPSIKCKKHTGGSQKRIAGSERKISGSEQSSDPDPLTRNNHSVLVNEVDFRLLQNYFNENEQIGMATNYKLKEVLSALFKFSIKCGYISTNPLNYVRVSGKDSTRSSQAKVYTDKDFSGSSMNCKPSTLIEAMYILLHFILADIPE